MTKSAEEMRTVVMERTFRHSPEKVWRALTESTLLAQWLMKNDFEPIAGRKFEFRSEPVPNWDGRIDCEVQVVEPMRMLAYTWSTLGLHSEVLWTLTPVEEGTRLRMEHSGFPSDQEAAFKGATYGWQRFAANLEHVLGELA